MLSPLLSSRSSAVHSSGKPSYRHSRDEQQEEEIRGLICVPLRSQERASTKVGDERDSAGRSYVNPSGAGAAPRSGLRRLLQRNPCCQKVVVGPRTSYPTAPPFGLSREATCAGRGSSVKCALARVAHYGASRGHATAGGCLRARILVNPDGVQRITGKRDPLLDRVEGVSSSFLRSNSP